MVLDRSVMMKALDELKLTTVFYNHITHSFIGYSLYEMVVHYEWLTRGDYDINHETYRYTLGVL